MDRARIGDELVPDAGAVHLFPEGRDLIGVDVRVRRAVEHQHPRADGLGVRRVGGVQGAVEADDAGERGARARQFEDRPAAEAVSDRRHAGVVDSRLGLERGEPGRGAGAQERPVRAELAGRLVRLLRIGRADALAVDVRHEGHVAQPGELPGAPELVVRRPHPLVHDEHAGAPGRRRVVVDDLAFQRRSALGVFHGPGHDRRPRARHGEQRHGHGHPRYSHGPLLHFTKTGYLDAGDRAMTSVRLDRNRSYTLPRCQRAVILPAKA